MEELTVAYLIVMTFFNLESLILGNLPIQARQVLEVELWMVDPPPTTLFVSLLYKISRGIHFEDTSLLFCPR